jgi:hypothetical protein
MMKKIYESPESITVNLLMQGNVLQVIVQSEDGDDPATREYNSSIWDDGDEKDGKKIFDEEW